MSSIIIDLPNASMPLEPVVARRGNVAGDVADNKEVVVMKEGEVQYCGASIASLRGASHKQMIGIKNNMLQVTERGVAGLSFGETAQ